FHSTWVNSMALELAGITANTKVPPGGEIVLDRETGEPTGILKEAAARLVRSHPGLQQDEKERREGLLATIRYANSLGLTSVHDMSGRDGLFDYLALAETGDLTLRIWFGQFRADMTQAVADRREVDARMAAMKITQDKGPLLKFGYIKSMI